MDRRQIETVVLTVLASVLKCEVHPDISREHHASWDSLKHIEIMFAMEDELKLQFTEEELANLDSAEKIVTLAVGRYAT